MYGAYLNGVEYINCSYNQVLSIGRPFNYTTPYGIYIANSGVNLVVNANTINNLSGGYGIYVTTTIGSPFQRNVISNNMIQIGELTNTTYGIYLTSVGQFAVAHNAVNVTSGSATATCIYLSSTNGATYNTVDVINNISSNQNQGYVIYLNDGGASVTSNILQPVNWKIDNNCYYGLATYPYRSNNFISGTLQNYQTATAIGLDSFSLVMNPVFVSSTNLRTTALPLNNVGRINTWVTTDIDGQLRGAMPDIGVNEFNPPLNDAGVVGFVLPKAPQDTGYTDVRVLIRNFGAGAITSTDVTYTDGVTTHTTTYTGNLPSNGLDTVTFNQTSGAGATNQQYHYMGNSLVFKAYTSNPNVSTDAEPLNDTLRLNVCRALSGVYTINPVGSGLTNFTSFTAAIAALNCGGVLGPVEFNVASGTYTEQIDLGIIPGASAANWIKFKSATQNRNDVILTFAPTTAITNYTVAYSGTNYVYFEYLTIRNTSATFGRVLSFGISGSRYASNNGIRECNIVGAVVTTTADANSLIFAAGGTHVQNIAISKCSLQNGSSAINFGGQNVINQYSDGLVIDSNTITGTYYYGIMLASRSNTKIRNNNILMGTAANYGIYITSGSNAMEISRNTVNTPLGYALYISTFNYYGELFSGRVFNNSFVVSSSATSGIYCTNVSNIRIYNNSVNIQSTSTTLTQGGLYISGSSGAAPVVNASQIYVYNNAIFSATLPALSLGNAAAISALVFNDHNVYSNTGTVLVYINGSSIASANFATVKGAINGLNDQNSYYTPAIGFTSNVNLTPLATNSSTWVLNGRGYHDFGLNSDIAGNFRSEAVSTGAPDIGAYEFTPVAAPPVSTVVGTIGYGNTQYFISFGDTIGSLTWGYSGTLPTSVNMAFYPGTLISNRATSPNNNVNIDTAAHLMDAYWRVSQNGGSNFYYDVRLRYKPFQLGTVPSETDLRFADRQVNTYHSWWRNNNFSTILDTVNNIIGMNFISDTSTYTGTTDISSPLPVKLNSLRATKSGLDGVLNWSTASERNSSVFIVERSFNRSNFTAVGRVAAAGNSSTTHRYDFIDAQVGRTAKNQTVFYRLKMVDLDGKFEYSPVVSVSFSERPTTGIVAYPNPFSSEVSINITAEVSSTAVVTVVDIMGRKVGEFTQQVSEGDNMISTSMLSNLNNGVYFVKVVVDGKEAVTKLIKQ